MSVSTVITAVLVATATVSIAGAYWLGHRAGAASVERAWEKERALAASAEAQLQARYREREKEMLREREIVEQNYLSMVERSRRDAAAAGSELEQLRRTIAARSARRAAETATCPASADDSAAERELLSTCAAEYQTMAREADEIADRLKSLQEREKQYGHY